jgi:hypothetical protein
MESSMGEKGYFRANWPPMRSSFLSSFVRHTTPLSFMFRERELTQATVYISPAVQKEQEEQSFKVRHLQSHERCACIMRLRAAGREAGKKRKKKKKKEVKELQPNNKRTNHFREIQ